MPPLVLIADDSPFIRDMMVRVFSAFGCEVTVVDDGLAAWSVIRGDPQVAAVDLAVLDIEMPELDGCQVCCLVKGEPSTQGIPVLLISGRVDAEELAERAGADAFLSKPFALEDLRMRVERLLGRPVRSDEVLEATSARAAAR